MSKGVTLLLHHQIALEFREKKSFRSLFRIVIANIPNALGFEISYLGVAGVLPSLGITLPTFDLRETIDYRPYKKRNGEPSSHGMVQVYTPCGIYTGEQAHLERRLRGVVLKGDDEDLDRVSFFPQGRLPMNNLNTSLIKRVMGQLESFYADNDAIEERIERSSITHSMEVKILQVRLTQIVGYEGDKPCDFVEADIFTKGNNKGYITP